MSMVLISAFSISSSRPAGGGLAGTRWQHPVQFPQGRGGVSPALAQGENPANGLFWSDGQAALLFSRSLSSAGGADTCDSHQGPILPVPFLQAAHPAMPLHAA